MIDDENITQSRNILGGSYLISFLLLVIQNLEKLPTIIRCIDKFEVERLDQLWRELGTDHLNSVELVKRFGSWGKVADWVIRYSSKCKALFFHIVDYYKI
jgi:hypothetical protein